MFIGQKRIVRELDALLLSEHKFAVLLLGEYGHGKTTLAKRLAKMKREPFVYYPTPRCRVNMGASTIIMDEIHLIQEEEALFPLFGVKNLIFCSTNVGNLSGAFRSRCITLTLQPYSVGEVAAIIVTNLEDKGMHILDSQAKAIARRARCNPRVAIQLAERIWRLSALEGREFNLKNIYQEFHNLGIDERGYDDRHRAVISYLYKTGRPVGIRTISRAINISESIIKEEVEPALIMDGVIEITRQGRGLIGE